MDIKAIDHKSDANLSIDKTEAEMLENFPAVDPKIRDYFTDGLYAREMTVELGDFEAIFITSEIHNTEHMYMVTKGRLIVLKDDGTPVMITAGFLGVTKPGTRRVALVIEDTVWTTFHPNPNNENADQIRERIIVKHDNPLITEELRKKMLDAKQEFKMLNQ